MKPKSSRHQKKRIIAMQTATAAPSFSPATQTVSTISQDTSAKAASLRVLANACRQWLSSMPGKTKLLYYRFRLGLFEFKRICERYALDIALAFSIFALILFVAAAVYISMTSPAAIEIQRQQQEYYEKLKQDESAPAAKRAWKRLYKQHGQPGAVIYEPGKKPYYINAVGQKCRFI